MELRDDTTIEAVLEYLIANGATDLSRIFIQLFDLAKQIERERHLKSDALRTDTRATGLCQRLQAQADRHPRWNCHHSGSEDRRSRG